MTMPAATEDCFARAILAMPLMSPAIAPKAVLTLVVVMVAVLSSIVPDTLYLVLVPLSSAALNNLGRHQLAELATGFLGLAAVILISMWRASSERR